MSNLSKGYIVMARSLFADPLYLEKKTFDRFDAWQWLIVKADYKTGSLYISERELSRAWKWTRGRVRKFLDMLQKNDRIQRLEQEKGTEIVLVNYFKYKFSGSDINPWVAVGCEKVPTKVPALNTGPQTVADVQCPAKCPQYKVSIKENTNTKKGAKNAKNSDSENPSGERAKKKKKKAVSSKNESAPKSSKSEDMSARSKMGSALKYGDYELEANQISGSWQEIIDKFHDYFCNEMGRAYDGKPWQKKGLKSSFEAWLRIEAQSTFTQTQQNSGTRGAAKAAIEYHKLQNPGHFWTKRDTEAVKDYFKASGALNKFEAVVDFHGLQKGNSVPPLGVLETIAKTEELIRKDRKKFISDKLLKLWPSH